MSSQSAATPPNAIVFGTGYFTVPQLVKAGIGVIRIGLLTILLARRYSAFEPRRPLLPKLPLEPITRIGAGASLGILSPRGDAGRRQEALPHGKDAPQA